MKDYLNTDERDLMLILSNHLDRIERMIVEWDKRGNLTKDERKALRTSLSWGLKAFESIVQRQNNSSLKALDRALKNNTVIIDMKSIAEVYKKKKVAQVDAFYEENKEYIRLVELIMDYNCKDCSKSCNKCDFYSEFEEQYIPDLSGIKKPQNCKYAYRSSDLK